MSKMFVPIKLAWILIGVLLVLAFVLSASCNKERSLKKDRYKEKKDETSIQIKSIHESNPKNTLEPKKLRDYNQLLNIQLDYAQVAKSKSHSELVKGYANKLIVEYQNTLIEMESLVSRESPMDSRIKTPEISDQLHDLQAADPAKFDQLFLEKTIDLQLEMRDVLWEKQKNTSNNDLRTFYEKLSQETELQIDHAITLLQKL